MAAFLRGSDRRAAVLAELQTGDAAAGDAAVGAAMRQFRSAAAGLPMIDWPTRLWSLLLAQPALRTRVPVALPLEATDRLGELGAGPRVALLLRIAAGLDDTTAAAVLGIPEASYRLALQRAMPRDAGGEADLQAWQRLREQVDRRIRSLPPERLLTLCAARESALHEPLSAPAAARPAAPARRILLAAAWFLLALCVAAFTATFFWRPPPMAAAGGDRFGTPLPEAPPASGYGREAGVMSHRDFALLADPDAAASEDLAFNSWLAAQEPGTVAPVAVVAAHDGLPAPVDATGSETDASE